MKVLIPFSYYYPEICAGIFVINDLVCKLAEQGIEAIIYVPTPTRNVCKGVEWKRDEYLYGGLVHIHRFRMYQEGKHAVFRALRYVFCEFIYLFYMLRDKYDVAFIDSTPPIQGLKLPLVRLFRKKPVIYNAQDLFPDTLSGAGLASREGILWKIGSWVARMTFRNSNKIIAISQDIKENLIRKGVEAEKIEVVYNWVDEKAIIPIPKADNPLFEEFGISRDKFIVVYAGNLGNAQNIDIIVDAAVLLKCDEDIQFVIFGTGGLEESIRERISSEHLVNLILLPLQPYEKVSYVYSLGDVCIVSCKAGLGGSAMPSKTWSIMSCGRPVVASFDEGELKDILESNDCGVFTRAGDLRGFVNAIKILNANRARCVTMGMAGRKFILDNLTKEVGTQKYVDVIKCVIENK
ncbi:glycosyltransferase family 4 protein [Butyricimonas virosa]|mgnify:CR=1 FL=1|uniref:glycosyltransferase family 4 protein n=1 Tax=Butyricimonas virosa TaxID=544645 RepID=UPI0032C0CD4A|nr:glycosyltransferase family 4 protein [Butyricimonas virosa]